MGYRGRLIRPVLVEIQPIDTLKTEQTSNYDHDFREPIKNADNSDGTQFGETYRLHAQFQTEQRDFQNLVQAPAGGDPDTILYTLFHYQELEDEGRLDDKGRPTIRLNDRLVAIYDEDGDLIREYDEDALFATEIKDRSHGLNSKPRRNLLRVKWEAKKFSETGV